MGANRWGCTICGHVSRTSRDAERHFDQKHKGSDFEEEPGWRDYFLGRKRRTERKEGKNVGCC